MLNDDYRDMLRCLSAGEVSYLLVGAHALAIHGYPRSTGDMDIWLEPTASNATAAYRALAAFGAPLEGIDEQTFTRPGLIYQIGIAPCRIDLMSSISGVDDFQEALDQAQWVAIDELRIPVLGMEQLLANKRAVGRGKDLDDVAWMVRRLAQDDGGGREG